MSRWPRALDAPLLTRDRHFGRSHRPACEDSARVAPPDASDAPAVVSPPMTAASVRPACPAQHLVQRPIESARRSLISFSTGPCGIATPTEHGPDQQTSLIHSHTSIHNAQEHHQPAECALTPPSPFCQSAQRLWLRSRQSSSRTASRFARSLRSNPFKFHHHFRCSIAFGFVSVAALRGGFRRLLTVELG